MKLIPLIADNWRMDGGVAFGVVPKSIWQKLREPDKNNMIAITTRCLLVIDGEKKILIDVGLGNKRNEKYYAVRNREPNVNIIHSMQQQGIDPGDITDIILTHLHDDHVGAATQLNIKSISECVFKKAQYYVSETQWEWALHPNKRESAAFFKDNFLPLKDSGRLHLLKENEQPFRNISLRIFNGHTRGQVIPMIHSRNQTIIFLGDFIPTASNIPLPYIPSVDIDPLLSLQEKENFLKEALENKYILFFEHDALFECCTLKQSEKGIILDKTFQLNEINF